MKSKVITIFLISSVFFYSCRIDDIKPIKEQFIDLHQFSKNHKGFNLQGKFNVNRSNFGFTENEFVMIKDLGFNFVRLPLDYRTYTKPGNWNNFIENEVEEIDDAIEWGKQYGIHVCLNLHRAPGYSVSSDVVPANQNLDLWSDPIAQEAFVNHWAYFANRYRNISYEDVSFNLVNEPEDMDEMTYVNIMQMAIDKIHEINPNRIVFVDGLDYSQQLIASFKNTKNVIQSIHMYQPFRLTHYRASWVEGSDFWPIPSWPVTKISNFLYGSWKNEFQSSLVFEGNFLKDGEIIINVHQVSVQSTLQIMLDDVEIYNKLFVTGPELEDDWTQIISTKWGYQNISNKDYAMKIPSDGQKLTISNTIGDWMTMNKITIKTGNAEISIVPGNNTWGSMQESYQITEGIVTDSIGNPILSFGNLIETLETAQFERIPVMIQEFGVYHHTPYDVAISYLSDVVDVFNTYQVGYSLWNLSGGFGIIDSERADASYTSYFGKQLDPKMTKIIQRK